MSIYGYCKECKMELTSRDQHFGPAGICEGCFDLEMGEDDDFVMVIDMPELWKGE